MGENQENITIHDCASAREGRLSHGLVHDPQEAEDSKEGGQELVGLPFKGYWDRPNSAPGWGRFSHRTTVDTRGLGPAYLY